MSGDQDALPRWSFGDNPQLADELLALVLARTKTATCGALWQYEAEGSALPAAGERSVVLDRLGRPACVVETVEVTIKRFAEVDESWARDEGEGDRSLAHCRREHEAFFKLEGTFSSDMPLVCERFRLVELLESAR